MCGDRKRESQQRVWTTSSHSARENWGGGWKFTIAQLRLKVNLKIKKNHETSKTEKGRGQIHFTSSRDGNLPIPADEKLQQNGKPKPHFRRRLHERTPQSISGSKQERGRRSTRVVHYKNADQIVGTGKPMPPEADRDPNARTQSRSNRKEVSNGNKSKPLTPVRNGRDQAGRFQNPYA